MNQGSKAEHTSTWREQMALETWLDQQPGDTIGDLHRKFCSKVRCPYCGEYSVCIHRDRVREIQEILRHQK